MDYWIMTILKIKWQEIYRERNGWKFNLKKKIRHCWFTLSYELNGGNNLIEHCWKSIRNVCDFWVTN